MIFLSKEDIKKCITMKEVVEADKEALKIYSEGKSNIPLRTNINVQSQNGQALFMPGLVEGENTGLGIKIVSVYPNNIEKGLPSVPATMISINPSTGIVEAILDGTYLTEIRTGAVAGAATDILARKDAKIGALIGTGGQAFSQLEAMLTVRDLEEVRIFDIDFERAKIFAENAKNIFNKNIYAVKTNKECVSNADIITTVTTSKRPTFNAEDVKEGAHINGVGSYTREMCEIPVEILQKSDLIVFDTIDGVVNEAGDIIIPLENKLLSKEKCNTELGQIILGDKKGRQNEKQITIFKSVGTAVLDVYVANKIVMKAKEKNIGINI